MSDTVNKSGIVESLLIKYLLKIFAKSILIFPIGYMFLNIIKHTLNLKVRTAMLRTLKRCNRCCNR